MKKTLTITALCICASMTIIGCSSKEPVSSETKTTASNEQTSEAITNTETENDTETVSSEEVSSDNENESPSDIPLQNNQTSASIPAEAGSMLEIAHALALCESDMETSYSSTDKAFFWNATAYLIAGYGMQSAAANIDEEGNLSLPSSTVKEYASAIFSDFNGNSDSLPEIPENVTAISYDETSDSYSIGAGGFSSTKVNTYECTSNGDETYTLGIELEVNDEQDSEKLGKWQMTISPSTYNGSGHPLFNYTVTAFKKVD